MRGSDQVTGIGVEWNMTTMVNRIFTVTGGVGPADAAWLA